MLQKLRPFILISFLSANAFGEDLLSLPNWINPADVSGTYRCKRGATTSEFTIDTVSKTMRQTANSEVMSGFYNTIRRNIDTNNEIFFFTVERAYAEGLGFGKDGKFYSPSLEGDEAFDSCSKS